MSLHPVSRDLPSHRFPNSRVYDSVENLPFLLIVEDYIADRLAIELYSIVLEDPLAEVIHDCLIARGPWLDHRSGEVIGVDDGETMLLV